MRELLGFGVGFAGAIVCLAVRASLWSAGRVSRAGCKSKARNECQRDIGRSWAVGREVVVTGPAVWVDGEGLSWWSCLDSLPLKEVRWGIRSYSSVRVGSMCVPIEIFGLGVRLWI